MKYLLDANTYIQAKNFYYQMNFCPAYWDWLDKQAKANIIGSIDFIQKELKDGQDDLSTWVGTRHTHFQDCTDEATQANFKQIADFVMNHQTYSSHEKSHFLAKGDPWLIAKCMATNATLVTLEAKVGDSSTKVKIPNICEEFEVKYITPYNLLSTLQPQFILK